MASSMSPLEDRHGRPNLAALAHGEIAADQDLVLLMVVDDMAG